MKRFMQVKWEGFAGHCFIWHLLLFLSLHFQKFVTYMDFGHFRYNLNKLVFWKQLVK